MQLFKCRKTINAAYAVGMEMGRVIHSGCTGFLLGSPISKSISIRSQTLSISKHPEMRSGSIEGAFVEARTPQVSHLFRVYSWQCRMLEFHLVSPWAVL